MDKAYLRLDLHIDSTHEIRLLLAVLRREEMYLHGHKTLKDVCDDRRRGGGRRGGESGSIAWIGRRLDGGGGLSLGERVRDRDTLHVDGRVVLFGFGLVLRDGRMQSTCGVERERLEALAGLERVLSELKSGDQVCNLPIIYYELEQM